MRPFAGCSAIALTLSLFTVAFASAAESPLWVRQVASPGSETMSGIVLGSDEGVSMAGAFSGNIDFDPEAGVFNLTALGTNDAYVTHYDRDGHLVWAGQLGGAGASASVALTGSIATAPGDVLYVSGVFHGTVDFDPGPDVVSLTSSDAGDIYVLKLSAAGQFIWVRQMTCSSGSAGPLAIVANAAGVSLTGTMGGTCDFDPGPGTEDRTINAGMEDFFVAALDAAGNFAWAGVFGSPGSDIPNGIAVDGSGNVYSVGRARGAIDYDPGPGTDVQTGDFYVLKQSPGGAEVWAKAIVAPLARAFGVTTDAAGGVYVSGQFTGTVDFDPGPGTASRSSAGSLSDAFALKLDSTGAFAWVATVGNTSTDVARRMVIEPDGRVRVVGQFSGTVDFDPGAGISNLTSTGASDGFLLTLDAAGQFAGAVTVGGTQADSMFDMATDPAGNVIVLGRFSATADFDPGPGTMPLTSAGGQDDFVWKYGSSELHLVGSGATSIAFSPGASNSFDVVKGTMSDLRGTADYSQAACLGLFTGGPAVDAAMPAVGDAFYYLARGRSCCAPEGYGDSSINPDPRDALDASGLCP